MEMDVVFPPHLIRNADETRANLNKLRRDCLSAQSFVYFQPKKPIPRESCTYSSPALLHRQFGNA